MFSIRIVANHFVLFAILIAFASAQGRFESFDVDRHDWIEAAKAERGFYSSKDYGYVSDDYAVESSDASVLRGDFMEAVAAEAADRVPAIARDYHSHHDVVIPVADDIIEMAAEIVANGNAPARRSPLIKLCSTFANTIKDDVKYIWRGYPLGVGCQAGTVGGSDGCLLFCVAVDTCFRSAVTIIGLPAMTCHGIYKAGTS